MVEKPLPTVEVHYIKSPSYHELPCDGAIGGINPRGDTIWMALFSERAPIPQVVSYQATPGPAEDVFALDETASPKFVQSRQGLIRVVDVSAYLSLASAKRLHAWLGERITQLEQTEYQNAVHNKSNDQ